MFLGDFIPLPQNPLLPTRRRGFQLGEPERQSTVHVVRSDTTRESRQHTETPDALGTQNTRMGKLPGDAEIPQIADAANFGDVVPEPPLGLSTDAFRAPLVAGSSCSGPHLSQTPASPSTRPSSRATTMVASPGRPRYTLPTSLAPQSQQPVNMAFLALLVKAAYFSNIFLSGLVVPLLPTMLQDRALVPHGQVQIWISVLVSAYGGALSAATPLIPFFANRGFANYGVFMAGLTCAAAAFALLQLSSGLPFLIIARSLQGLGAAAITKAYTGIRASTANIRATLLTPAFIQSVAMATAPTIAGLLNDHYSIDAVFFCAYALIGLNVVLGLLTFTILAPAAPVSSASRPESPQRDTGGQQEPQLMDVRLLPESPRGGYGTIPSRIDGSSTEPQRSSSAAAPSSLSLAELDAPAAATTSTTFGTLSPRLLVALFGYLVMSLLTSALHSVLPLFVQRHFNWSVFATGSLFVPLSAPAAIIGPVAGLLTSRVPRSTRFLAAIGFLAWVPSLLQLGQLTGNTTMVQQGFLLTLSGLSLATGLSGDPLVAEVANAVSSSASNPGSATAQAANLPDIANALGSMVGPLLAGAVSSLWGWQAMNSMLGGVAAATSVGSLLFLQGWIGNPYPGFGPRHHEASSDEESAPLLANEQSDRGFYDHSETYGSKNEAFGAERQNSDAAAPHARKNRTHRRHFSVDNFSVNTATAPGSMDSSASSVRFQAALEMPAHGQRPGTSDSAGKASAERRYVLREAPHAPSTDPLLAAGSLYVIDEERESKRAAESQRQKRRVVVFPEGSAPPELLRRHRHHVVAINALDGTAQMVSDSTDNHAVHVTEAAGTDEGAFAEATCRRYVVVVVEGEDVEMA
ncbi:MFS general substrate transporter [Parathielavia hyrcaniae]|uniref:MFS general substrate transporter n=1 Tax=Parathielavia hyrcaniae TaxID=113614 RepID=A0AAN6Q4H1_9PEZI|nr:MFS general substrate transporter [Parathielavia hyrcaniae]